MLLHQKVIFQTISQPLTLSAKPSGCTSSLRVYLLHIMRDNFWWLRNLFWGSTNTTNHFVLQKLRQYTSHSPLQTSYTYYLVCTCTSMLLFYSPSTGYPTTNYNNIFWITVNYNTGRDQIKLGVGYQPSSSSYSMKNSSNPAKISNKFRIEILSPSTMLLPVMWVRSTLRISEATESIKVWQFKTCCSFEMGFSTIPVKWWKMPKLMIG